MGKTEKRWTASHAGAVLDAADVAKSDRAYATATGIAIGRVAWWRAKLCRLRGRPIARVETAQVAFVEVKSPPPDEGTTVEVLLCNGRQLRVSDRIAPAIVARLADALEKIC